MISEIEAPNLWDREIVEARVREITEAGTENFVELLHIAGLDPNRDLRFTDWSGVDFSGCDLVGFDFTGANLKGCLFEGLELLERGSMPRKLTGGACCELRTGPNTSEPGPVCLSHRLIAICRILPFSVRLHLRLRWWYCRWGSLLWGLPRMIKTVLTMNGHSIR